jgi:two-component system phosphate regulon sensor histidine kinase PhoR
VTIAELSAYCTSANPTARRLKRARRRGQSNFRPVTSDHWTMLIHDLRNPLATVHGYTQLLLRHDAERSSEVPGLGESLRHIQDAAARIERLVDQLATTPHLTGNQPRALPRSLTDLVQLARRMAAQSQPAAGKSDRVTVLPAVSELIGCWDATSLERLLGNLLDNALKYSPANGPVVVTLRSAGGWAVMSVADQGIGIPPADLPKVFDRGYRAATAVSKAPGRGIGLAAVQSIVHAHGGTISIDSEEGVGTTVTVRLPLAEQAVHSATLRPPGEFRS